MYDKTKPPVENVASFIGWYRTTKEVSVSVTEKLLNFSARKLTTEIIIQYMLCVLIEHFF